VDLASSAEVLDRAIGNRYYLFRFLKTLAGKVRAKAERFPGQVDSRAWKGVRTIREIDEFYTGPVHGFADAEDYWANCSARGFLAGVCVPSLLVSAVDDPLLAGPSFPREIAEQSSHFFLEAPATGGHVAFLGRKAWLGRRIVSFVDSGERM
jgi:predicted alpha/beta-fold hydrolase